MSAAIRKISVSIIALCAPLATHAQEAAGSAPQAQEERAGIADIVVTARKVTEVLQDVPVAISAQTGAQLQAKGVTDALGLARVTPGLFIGTASSRSNGLNVYIRSQGQNDATSIFDPSVALYMDGVYIARSQGANTALYDIERIEVLKGPQGTLYGRNSTGGAVGMFSRQPKLGEVGGYVQGTYGEYNLMEVQGAVNLPIGDSVAIRASGFRRYRDKSWIRDSASGAYYDLADQWAGRVNLLWQASDTVKISAGGFYIKDTSRPNVGILTGVGVCGATNNPAGVPTTADCNENGALSAALPARLADRRVTQQDTIPTAYMRNWGGHLTFEAEISDTATVKNIAAYRSLYDDPRFELDGVANLARNITSTFLTDQWQFTNESQVTGTAFDGKLKYAAGLYYLKEEARERNQSSQFGSLNPANPTVTEGLVRNESYSAYAQGTYSLLDELRLTLGGRYTIDRRAVTQANRNALGCTLRDATETLLPANACERNLNASFKAFSYNVTVDYDIGPKTLIYIAHRQGYRAGGINLRGNRVSEVQPTKPEFVRDVELGMKGDFYLGNMPLRINGAAFYQWYSDIQRSLPVVYTPQGSTVPVTGSAVLNAASATIYGGEVEITLQPTRGFDINFGLASSIARYDKFERTVVVGTTPTVQDLSGNRFYGSPDLTFSAGFNYERDLGFAKGAVNFDARWQDKIYFSIINSQPASQSPYWLLNGRFDLKNIGDTGLDVGFWVKNITDKTYAAGNFSDFYYSLGYAALAYAPPRTIGATATFRFGSDR